jgi:hypothetical protein
MSKDNMELLLNQRNKSMVVEDFIELIENCEIARYAPSQV